LTSQLRHANFRESTRETGPRAKAAALDAIALDDDSAEAHWALAIARTWIEWDWAGAEPE